MKISREKQTDMAGGGGKMIRHLYVCKRNPSKWNGHKFKNKITFLCNERNVVSLKEITLYIKKINSKALSGKIFEPEDKNISFHECSVLCSRSIQRKYLKTQMHAYCI